MNFGIYLLEHWNLVPHARDECMGKTFRNIPSYYFTPLQNFCLDYQLIEYCNCSDDCWGREQKLTTDSSHEVPFLGKYLSHSPVTNCPLRSGSENSRSKHNSAGVFFRVDILSSGKLLCIHQSSPLPLLVTAEPSLAFDQRQSKWFPAFWTKKEG